MNIGNWKIVQSEVVSSPICWPGQEKKESDIGIKTEFECTFCGFKKSWIHRVGVTPDLYNYCPGCGERMDVERGFEDEQ